MYQSGDQSVRGARLTTPASVEQQSYFRRIGLGVAWGMLTGVIAATLLSVIVLIGHFGGAHSTSGQQGLPVGAVLTAYYAGCILGGALVGLLHPIGRWAGGAALLGLIGTISLFVCVGISMYGLEWSTGDTVSVAIPSILIGPVLGLALRRKILSTG